MLKVKEKIIRLLVGLVLVAASTSLLASSYGVSGMQPEQVNAVQPSTQQQNQPSVKDQLAALSAQTHQSQATPSSSSAQASTSVDQQNTSSESGSSNLGDTELSEQAFTKTLQNAMPLTPAQIKTMRKMYDDSQAAAAAYPGTAPKPTSKSDIISLAPGATPPVIRLQAGYVTSLVFVDSSGQPWPITAYDLGDPDTYSIQPTAPDGKSNTLIIQSKSAHKSGNLAVMLKDLNTPVMITLMPGQKNVDYRVDMRIPGLGPNAKALTVGMPESSNPTLASFLDGVAPAGAKLLKLEGGGDSQIWLYAHHLYMRTRLTMMSPSWSATMKSPDGTNVYEFAETPVVLVSNHGKLMQLKVEGL